MIGGAFQPGKVGFIVVREQGKGPALAAGRSKHSLVTTPWEAARNQGGQNKWGSGRLLVCAMAGWSLEW
jgi:hypothetical protein